MTRGVAREFSIELLFDKRSDGLYHIHSPVIPGLHLAGDDFDALRRDIEPVVKDLLWFNRQMVADQIRWVPSLDDVQDQLEAPLDEPRKATYVVTVGNAA